MKAHKFFLILVLIIFGTAFVYADWPDNIDKLSTSLCVVEYYQPQAQLIETKHKTRIKRKITGVLVTKDGLVVTPEDIYPVNLDISSASGTIFGSLLPEDITVIFEQDKKFSAEFLGKDDETNLGFIKITEPEDLPEAVNFKVQNEFRLGESIYLIEKSTENYDFSPMSFERHINAIIKKPRLKLITESSNLSLSSGGIAVNSNGDVYGLIQIKKNTAVDPHDFLETSSKTCEILIASHFNGLIRKPPSIKAIKQGSGKSWIGIQMQILKKEMAEYWELDNTSGIIITRVVPQSPAEKYGLQVGDIITRIENLAIRDDNENNIETFRNYIRNLPEGPVFLQYIRDGKKYDTEIELQSAPKSRFLADEYSLESLGFSVKELTQDIFLRNNYEFDTQGVWVSRIENAGIAGLSDLRVNDIILQVNDREVSNLQQFKDVTKKVLEQKPEIIKLFILRNAKTKFLFLKTMENQQF